MIEKPTPNSETGRSALVIFLVATVTFVGGFCLGLFVTGSAPNRIAGGNADAAPSRSASNGLDGAQVDSLLPARARQLQYDLDQEKQKEKELLLKDHLELFNKYKLSPTSWGEDLKITDQMADFLKMSPAERAAANKVLAETFARNRVLQAQHLKLISQKDNAVTYQISAYPEGSLLRDQLQHELANTLGPDRAAVVMESNIWLMNQAFSDFGAGDTQIALTRMDQSGPPRYQIMESFSNGYTTTTTGNELPRHLVGLLQLDPSP